MHSSKTLAVFERVTRHLGNALRYFARHTCSAFPQTVETDAEYQSRRRNNDRQKSRTAADLQSTGSSSSRRIGKTFNLATPKFHSLGDYVATIYRFGTTDSYSTQTVCTSLLAVQSLSLIFIAGRTRTPAGKTAVQAVEQAELCGSDNQHRRGTASTRSND